MTFRDWLAANHPDVRLTPMQQAWADGQERGERPLWTGGVASGKTFVFRLYEAFLRAEHK